MNKRKILIFGVVVIALGCGLLLGRMTATQMLDSDTETVSDVTENTAESITTEQSSVVEEIGGESSSDVSGSLEVRHDEEVNSGPALTEGQRKLISAMGLDPNNFTITSTMVACAEAKIGVARVEEIKNGATPSLSEGVSLYACYK